MSRTPTTPQPIGAVEWVDPDTLHANSYNPNRVFGPEFELLKRSLLEDGWCAAVVVRDDGEVVDGFHRWTLSRTDPDVRAMTGGLVPVVRLRSNRSRADQQIATVRFNRARGHHGVLKMGEILRQLSAQGLDEAEIAERLKMEREEVARLLNVKGTPDLRGRDSFSRGWVTVPTHATDAKPVATKSKPKRR